MKITKLNSAQQTQKSGEALFHNLKAASFLTLPVLSFVASLALPSIARADDPAPNQLPYGGSLAAGSGSMNVDGNTLNINQTSDRGLWKWQSFDTGRDATVNIDQPYSSSWSVQQVVGQKTDPTKFYGSLNSNGNVMILDRNGVLFGKDARIDTSGIVASTGVLNEDKFMNHGTIELSNFGDGAIVNEGTISVRDGGLAAFVAPTVVNNGVINAKMGQVALAGGNTKATVDMYGDNLVEFEVSDDAKKAIVSNGGVINAEGGMIAMTTGGAKAVVDSVINMTGVASAKSATMQGGKIVLGGAHADVNVSGTLDASGTQAGTIKVTGENINIASAAELNAISTAAGAKGGHVDVIADKHANFNGKLNVSSVNGQGGDVETSGHETIDFGDDFGVVVGNGGNWLIDPTNININSGLASAISGNLQSGANVEVNTNAAPYGGAGADAGIITVGSTIFWTGTGNLMLAANSDINFNAGTAIISGGVHGTHTQGTIGLYSNGNINLTGATLLSNTGNIATTSLGTTTIAGASSQLGAVLSYMGGQIDILANQLNIGASSGTGNLTQIGSSADVNLSSVAGTTITSGFDATSKTQISSLEENVNIISNGGIIIAGANTDHTVISADDTLFVIADADNNNTGNVLIQTGAYLGSNSGVGIGGNKITLSGGTIAAPLVNLVSKTDITQNSGTSKILAGALIGSATTGVSLKNSLNDIGLLGDFSAGTGDFILNDSANGLGVVGNVTAAGDVDLTTVGDLIVTGNTGHSVEVKSTGGDVNLTGTNVTVGSTTGANNGTKLTAADTILLTGNDVTIQSGSDATSKTQIKSDNIFATIANNNTTIGAGAAGNTTIGAAIVGLNGDADVSGTGDLIINDGTEITTTNNTYLAGKNIKLTGGSIKASGLGVTATGSVTQDSDSILQAGIMSGSAGTGADFAGTNNALGKIGDFAAGNGAFKLKNNNATFDVTGTVSANGGDIDISNTGGYVNLADTGGLTTFNGNVLLSGTDLLLAGNASTSLNMVLNATTGSITQTGGSLLVGNNLNVLAGTSASLSGANQVGKLKTATTHGDFTLNNVGAGLNVIGAVNSNGGNIDIDTKGKLGVTSTGSVTSGGGNVNLANSTANAITVDGTITAGNGDVVIDSTKGNIDLNGTVTTTGGDISATAKGQTTINGTVQSGSGDIALSGGGVNFWDTGLMVANAGRVQSTSGDINLTAKNTKLVINGKATAGTGDLSAIADDAGRIEFWGAGELQGENVDLQSGLGITEGTSGKITAGTLTASAKEGIELSGQNVIKKVGTVNAGTAGAGGFTLNNDTNRLDIAGAVTAKGDVNITNRSELRVNSTGSVFSNGGNINLANTQAAFIYVDSTVNAGTGDVAMNSGSNIELRSGSNIKGDEVTLNSGNVVNQNAAGRIVANTLGGTVDKSITLAGTNNKIAGLGNLTAGASAFNTGGINITNGVDLTVSGTVSNDGGNIAINNTGNVNVTGAVSAKGGNVAINQTGTFTGAADSIRTSGTGTISLWQRVGGFIGNAVAALSNTGTGTNTVNVADGTYNENVIIDQSNTNLVSQNGRAATTINGIANAGALGTVVVTDGTNKVHIGETGHGFTINGFDSANPGIENAAVYLQGAHDRITIQDNEIVANGDEALLSEYGRTNSNITIDNNTFSGKTYAGASYPTSGNQFEVANVPRQLVSLNLGLSDTTFTNNKLTGDAGNRQLLQLNSIGSTISDNTFDGTTTAQAMFVRGSNATISGNTIDGNGTTALGVYTENVNGLTVDDNTIDNTASAIVINGGSGVNAITNNNVGLTGNISGDGIAVYNLNGTAGVDVSGNDVANTSGNGIRVDGVNGTVAKTVQIKENNVGNSGADQILVQNGSYANVEDNTTSGYATYSGISFHDQTNSRAYNNTIENNALVGIYAEGSNGIEIDDNTISNSRMANIHVEGSNNAKVTNNTVSSTIGDGINIGGAINSAGVGTSGAIITGNTVTGAQGNGIYTLNASGSDISGNTVEDNGAAGIRMDGTSTATTFANNKFAGNTQHISYRNGAGADLLIGEGTGNQFDLGNGYTLVEDMDLADKFALEDVIEHQTDNAGYGLVRFGTDGEIYVTSNTLGIQNAIDAASEGDKVIIDGSTYQEHLIINKGLKLEGHGTTLNAINNTSLVTITADNVNIDPMTFDGGNISLRGIDASGADNLIVDGNTFLNFTEDGIHVAGSNNVTLTDNIVYNVGQDGIDVSGGTSHLIKRNAIGYTDAAGTISGANNNIGTGGNGSGIVLSDSANTLGDETLIQGNKITETVFNNGGGNGVQVSNSQNVKVGGAGNNANTIKNVEGDGISIKNGTVENITVQNNTIDGTGRVGIYTENANSIDILGNKLSNINRYAGIYAYQGSDISVVGNTIYNSDEAGIYLNNVNTAGPGFSEVRGNQIDNTGLEKKNSDGTNSGDAILVSGSNIKITDNAIGNNGGNIAGDGIDASGTGLTIRGNTINDADDNGISVSNASGVTIGGNALNAINYVTSVGGDGIRLANVSDFSVVNNRVDDAFDGISLISTTGLGNDVRNNIIGANSGVRNNGIYVLGVTDKQQINKNTITNAALNGILVQNSSNVLVGGANAAQANTINGTGAGWMHNGVYVLGGSDNDVTYNIVNNAGGHGIVVDGSTDANVAGNAINDATFNGVQLYHANGAKVDDNVILGAQTGIGAETSSDIKVRGNTIGSAVKRSNTGIELYYGVPNAEILGNTIFASGVGINVLNAGGQFNDNVTIGSLSDPNIIDGGTIGVSIDGGKHMTVEGNEVSNTSGDGIYVQNLTGANMIFGNELAGIGQNGIHGVDSNNLTVSTNHITGTNTKAGAGANGILVTGNNNATIETNTILGGNGAGSVTGKAGAVLDGIHVENNNGVEIFGNVIRGGNAVSGGGNGQGGVGAGNDGIEVTGSAGAVISSNAVQAGNNFIVKRGGRGAVGNGFNIHDNAGVGNQDGVKVTGNFVTGNALVQGAALDGINVSNSAGHGTGADADVSGNTITNVGQDGVQVSDTNKANITGNHVATAGANGILVSGSNNVNIDGNFIGDGLRGGAAQDGIHVDGGRNATINNNTIRGGLLLLAGAGDNGIEVNDNREAVITNNHITGGTILARGANNNGIYVNNSGAKNLANGNGVTVTGNFVTGTALSNGAGQNGIVVIDSAANGTGTRAEISNNTVTYASNGLNVQDMSANIEKNTLTHLNNTGIVLSNTDVTDVFDNTIDDALIGIDAKASGSDELEIDFNHLTNVDTGINADSVKNLSIIRNDIDAGGAGDYGIYVTGSNGVRVGGNGLGNTVVDFSQGIHVDGSNNARVNWNDVTGFLTQGIFVQNANNAHINRNTVHDGSGQAIWLSGGTGSEILRNTVDTVIGTGINVSNTTGTTIARNTITDASDAGIYGDTLTNAIIAQNTIGNTGANTTQYGIRMLDGVGVLIGEDLVNGYTGNTITAGTDAAILVEGGSVNRVVANNLTDGTDADDLADFGVQLVNTANGIVTGNTVAGRKVGIGFNGGNDNEASFNILTGNDTGIRFFNTTDSSIVNNATIDGNDTGIEITGTSTGTIIDNNLIDNGTIGILTSGSDVGTVAITNTDLTNNTTGIRLESGLVDLSSLTDGNTITGGDVGLQLAPLAGFEDNLNLVGDTLGSTRFVEQANYFVRMEDGAYLFGGTPFIIDALNVSFTKGALGLVDFVPANSQYGPGVLTLAQLQALESMIFDLDDSVGRGQIFVGTVPGLDESDLFPNGLGTFGPNSGGFQLTILGLPSVPGSAGQSNLGAFLNNLTPFAGGDSSPEALANITPAAGGDGSDLNNITPAAGETVGCWADVGTAVGSGAVTYNFGNSSADAMDAAAGCGG